MWEVLSLTIQNLLSLLKFFIDKQRNRQGKIRYLFVKPQ